MGEGKDGGVKVNGGVKVKSQTNFHPPPPVSSPVKGEEIIMILI
jgi:hypothetical protein